MFDNLMRSLGYPTIEDAYLHALQIVLQHLKPRWGDSVSDVLAAAQRGHNLDAAGQTLSDALKTWETEIKNKFEKKLQASSREVFELEESLRDLERELKDKNERLTGFQQLTENQNRTISKMDQTIKAQNVVIAEQYYKLSSVFGGDADNSHDAQKLLS